MQADVPMSVQLAKQQRESGQYRLDLKPVVAEQK